MVTWSLEGCCIPDSRGARPMWLSQVLGSTSCGDLWQNVLQIWCSVSSRSQAEPRLNPPAAWGVFEGVYMGAPEHRNLQECRKKRLGDRSCKSGDPGLEGLKLRLLGTIQKLMTPYTPDPLRLNVALSQLLHPGSSLFPTITSSESSLLSWSSLRFLCRSACVRPSYPSCSRCPTSMLICTVVSGHFLSLRFPIRMRTPPTPKSQPGLRLKRVGSRVPNFLRTTSMRGALHTGALESPLRRKAE